MSFSARWEGCNDKIQHDFPFSLTWPLVGVKVSLVHESFLDLSLPVLDDQVSLLYFIKQDLFPLVFILPL